MLALKILRFNAQDVKLSYSNADFIHRHTLSLFSFIFLSSAFSPVAAKTLTICQCRLRMPTDNRLRLLPSHCFLVVCWFVSLFAHAHWNVNRQKANQSPVSQSAVNRKPSQPIVSCRRHGIPSGSCDCRHLLSWSNLPLNLECHSLLSHPSHTFTQAFLN
jgi:hypothetical protein